MEIRASETAAALMCIRVQVARQKLCLVQMPPPTTFQGFAQNRPLSLPTGNSKRLRRKLMNQNIAEAAARRHGFRFGNNTSEPITWAVGLRAHQPLHVVDATAGLGRDAFLLASLAA
jgi:Putative SAM-dependent methyltransferase